MLKKLTILVTIFSFSFMQLSFAATNEPRLYATLVKNNDGKYVISRIASYPSPDAFDLETLKPVNIDTRRWDCSKMWFGFKSFNDKQCVPPDSKFRKTHIGLANVAATVGFWVFSFGIGLITGFIDMDSVFDEQSYNNAVSEALTGAGLTSSARMNLIQKYNSIFSQRTSYISEMDSIYYKYSNLYEANISEKKDIKLIDLSGYYNNDISVGNLVQIKKNILR